MNKRWIFTFRVEPPKLQTVMVRSGGSVFDAAFSTLLGQWYMVLPGGSLEQIPAPEMMFVSEDWAREHPAADLSRSSPVKQIRARRSKKNVQLTLF